MRDAEEVFLYCLIFPDVESAWGFTIVRGSECDTLVDAETLHADRIANGEAFPGERATLCDAAFYDAANK